MKPGINNNNGYLQKLPFHILILAILFFASVLIFGFIVHKVIVQNEDELDRQVAGIVSYKIVHIDLTPAMVAITFFASRDFLLVAFTLLVGWYLFYLKLKRKALDIAAIAISGFLMNFFMKRFFQRSRPDGSLMEELQNYSFPSGHASLGFIFFGLLAYLTYSSNLPFGFRISTAILFILFSLMIGFSRIYLRMHHTTDVIAGFCLGFAWLTMALWVLRKSKYWGR